MRTFKKEIKISGVGIHSGAPVNMRILPADQYGIFFKRVDMPGTDLIPAKWDNVKSAVMNTTIGDPNGAHVQTIEHFMAALFMVGIDSAVIEIDGPETPIMDGSANEFLKIFDATEIAATGPLKKIIVKKEIIAHKTEILKQLSLIKRVALWLYNLKQGRKENGYVKLSPYSKGLKINATLIYPDKIIGEQSFSYMFDGSKKSIDTFLSDISSARTFGRISEWEYLKARGMGRGADENNVIALNAAGDASLNGLIWPDEFVRHKVIDALGDLYISGGFICGEMTSFKGSHALNNLVLKKLFSDPSNYDIMD